jgi:nitrogen fixation NifU-like protein
MDELAALYQATLLDHAKHPRFALLPEQATHTATLDNPLCGDQVRVALVQDRELLIVIGCKARGCAICMAAASMMCSSVAGASVVRARELCDRILALIAARDPTWPSQELGELVAFAAVARFPARSACASLPWLALRSALA